MEAISRARGLVDEAHRADPRSDSGGTPAELVYADRVESWTARLVPRASPLLLLAARCQHLERWSIPRDTYPMNRAGYNAWRRALYQAQATRARSLLLRAGLSEEDAEQVATWVSKSGLTRNAGSQALEDAACLVFLENEIEDFAAQHEEYPREKFVTILERIWRKMSPLAREHGLRLEMKPATRALVEEANSLVEARERSGQTRESGGGTASAG